MIFKNNTQRVLSFSGFCLNKGMRGHGGAGTLRILSLRRSVSPSLDLLHPSLPLCQYQQDLYGSGNSISTLDEDASRLI